MQATKDRDPLLSDGYWLRWPGSSIAGSEQLHRRVLDEIIKGVRAIRGDTAAETIQTGGVGLLHMVVDAREVGRLRDHVIENLRNELLDMAIAVGRSLLHWPDDFYVDDYLILRINFPYEVARLADPTAENPGIGRVSPWMRDIAQSRRVIDPVYDPKGYHKGHPPAAWAHGPHLDSWAGHSKDGLNIWWAISDVPAEAGMVLYPELAGRNLPYDPRTLYIKAGFPLPRPTSIPLEAGELLVFDPEILHGTHLNVTEKTRVAISLRLNSKKPIFDPNCFYAREFWRRASDIESGRYSEVLHLRRENNLAPMASEPPVEWPARRKDIEIHGRTGASTVEIGPASVVQDGTHIGVLVSGRRVLIYRVGGKLRAIDAACPHYGLDLSDGAEEQAKIFCPGCGISFDLMSGRSLAPSLTLQMFDVEEEDGVIFLRLPAGGAFRPESSSSQK